MSEVRVGNPQYGQLHRYDWSSQVIRCSGQWFPIGQSPCEDAERRALPDPADLPPCEATDEDLAAARELLGTPDRVWLCKQKGRASWHDAPATAQAMANRMLEEQLRNPLPHLPGRIGDSAP